METKNILEVHQLSFRFSQTQPYFFKDLSITFEKKNIHFITGRNGSGKSLFFRLIQGLARQREVVSGELFVDGKKIALLSTSNASAELTQYIGLVLQKADLMLADQFSVAQNLALANIDVMPRFASLPIHKQVPDFLLRSIGDLNRPVRLLSGGQRQMLAIMMKLQKSNKLLLLDEPTAALDDDNATMVMDFIQQLVEQTGLTVLMICHDQELIKRYARGYVYRVIKSDADIRRVEITLS